jgi:hypothetical protein
LAGGDEDELLAFRVLLLDLVAIFFLFFEEAKMQPSAFTFEGKFGKGKG